MSRTSPRLLTIQESAERLSVSPATIRRRITAGALAVVRDGRIVRVSERALAEYVESRTRPAVVHRPVRRPAPAKRRRPPTGTGRRRRLWEVDA